MLTRWLRSARLHCSYRGTALHISVCIRDHLYVRGAWNTDGAWTVGFQRGAPTQRVRVCLRSTQRVRVVYLRHNGYVFVYVQAFYLWHDLVR
jgi:hypothetical protein